MPYVFNCKILSLIPRNSIAIKFLFKVSKKKLTLRSSNQTVQVLRASLFLDTLGKPSKQAEKLKSREMKEGGMKSDEG